MYKNIISNIRERNGVSKQEIANILKIDRTSYAHYELEDRIMPIKYLNKVCNHFDISIDYAFEFTNTKNYKNMKTEINTILSGIKIKEFRKEKNLTQNKLAEILNIASTMVSKYEKGEFIISTHALYDICRKYNISADYLLGKIDTPKYLK